VLGRRWFPGGGELPQANIHALGRGCVSELFLKELYVFSQETLSSFEEGSIVFLGGAMGMWMMLECIGGSQRNGMGKGGYTRGKKRGLGRGLGKYFIFFSKERSHYIY
jgi:hypothetical protein